MGDRLEIVSRAADFPGLAQRVHDAPLAYLDNAASTHMAAPVIEAMRRYEQTSRANIHRGVHTLSQRSTEAFDAARARMKKYVGAGAQHELIFTSGTTEALNTIAHGLSDSGLGAPLLREGDEIIVSVLEHHANLVPWQAAARRSGARLVILHSDEAGQLHPDALASLLTARTRVFSVTACANASGERPPYEELLAMARDAGAITVLDAAQAVAHDVPRIGELPCDFMAFSGHKMYGPMGIGALVGRREALEQLAPLRLGGDMVEWVHEQETTFAPLPARLEGGTPNVAGAVGMAAAADYIDSVGLDVIDAHVRSLRAHAVARLAALEGIRVLSPGTERTAIASFLAEGAHPHDLGTLLDRRGVAVRTGNHCAQPLLDWLGIGPTTRASFAIYNSHEEVDRMADAVAEALEILR